MICIFFFLFSIYLSTYYRSFVVFSLSFRSLCIIIINVKFLVMKKLYT